MPTCQKCDVHFPCQKVIDGKRRQLASRKYCLECSPFRAHNTRKLESFDPESRAYCADCGRPFENSYRRAKCGWCYSKASWRRRQHRLKEVVGWDCWLCGYTDRSEHGIFPYHHVKPAEKKMTVSNALRGSIRAVVEEARKCILVCPTCHVEIHAGLIEMLRVEQVHQRLWTPERQQGLQLLLSVGGRAA